MAQTSNQVTTTGTVVNESQVVKAGNSQSVIEVAPAQTATARSGEHATEVTVVDITPSEVEEEVLDEQRREVSSHMPPPTPEPRKTTEEQGDRTPRKSVTRSNDRMLSPGRRLTSVERTIAAIRAAHSASTQVMPDTPAKSGHSADGSQKKSLGILQRRVSLHDTAKMALDRHPEPCPAGAPRQTTSTVKSTVAVEKNLTSSSPQKIAQVVPPRQKVVDAQAMSHDGDRRSREPVSSPQVAEPTTPNVVASAGETQEAEPARSVSELVTPHEEKAQEPRPVSDHVEKSSSAGNPQEPESPRPVSGSVTLNVDKTSPAVTHIYPTRNPHVEHSNPVTDSTSPVSGATKATTPVSGAKKATSRRAQQKASRPKPTKKTAASAFFRLGWKTPRDARQQRSVFAKPMMLGATRQPGEVTTAGPVTTDPRHKILTKKLTFSRSQQGKTVGQIRRESQSGGVAAQRPVNVHSTQETARKSVYDYTSEQDNEELNSNFFRRQRAERKLKKKNTKPCQVHLKDLLPQTLHVVLSTGSVNVSSGSSYSLSSGSRNVTTDDSSGSASDDDNDSVYQTPDSQNVTDDDFPKIIKMKRKSQGSKFEQERKRHKKVEAARVGNGAEGNYVDVLQKTRHEEQTEEREGKARTEINNNTTPKKAESSVPKETAGLVPDLSGTPATQTSLSQGTRENLLRKDQRVGAIQEVLAGEANAATALPPAEPSTKFSQPVSEPRSRVVSASVATSSPSVVSEAGKLGAISRQLASPPTFPPGPGLVAQNTFAQGTVSAGQRTVGPPVMVVGRSPQAFDESWAIDPNR